MIAYHKKCHNKNFEKSRGLAVVSVLISFSLLILSLLYLVQTNSLVGCSYKIRQQKEYLGKLKKNKQNIEMEIAGWHSPAKLEQIVDSLGLVEIGEVMHLDTGEKSMTMKNL